MTTEEETLASYKLVFENQPVGVTEEMRKSHKTKQHQTKQNLSGPFKHRKVK